jgi:formylmethanofuran dehydrogenase subunit E
MKRTFAVMVCLFLAFNIFNGCEEKNTEISSISIYDEDSVLKISLKDVEKYHGDICPCVVIAFRATQLAISELWKDEIPKREDFKIINSLPTHGAEDTFEFITRVKRRKDFEIKLPEGTSNLITSEENYSFVFMRKSTGKKIIIKVKKEIFQKISGSFFSIRTKIKLKTVTDEEKKEFKLAKHKLKDIFINSPIDELFEMIK